MLDVEEDGKIDRDKEKAAEFKPRIISDVAVQVRFEPRGAGACRSES